MKPEPRNIFWLADCNVCCRQELSHRISPQGHSSITRTRLSGVQSLPLYLPTATKNMLNTIIICDILSITQRVYKISVGDWDLSFQLLLSWAAFVWPESEYLFSHVTPSPSSLRRSDLLDGPALTETRQIHSADSQLIWHQARDETTVLYNQYQLLLTKY